MNITYTKEGDYYLPNLKFPEQINNTEIGKYGRLRLKYLKENKKEIYTILRVNNRLKEHLICINNEAEKRVKIIINEMCKIEKVDEKLKENNQIEWVKLLNNFKNIAEEIVIRELIYVWLYCLSKQGICIYTNANMGKHSPIPFRKNNKT